MKLRYQTNLYFKFIFENRKIDQIRNKIVIVSAYHRFMPSIVRLSSI